MTAVTATDPAPHPAYAGGVDTIGRRRLLQMLVGTATFVGFTIIGMFKFAPKAGAYNEWGVGSQSSACGEYDPDTWNGFDGSQNGYAGSDCQTGACVGVPAWAMGRSYCSTCGELGSNNPNQWHFSGYRGGYAYGDLWSQICNPTGSGGRDAWRWAQASCGYCNPATWRCHDGFKIAPDDTFATTICQGLVYCNGSVYSGCN